MATRPVVSVARLSQRDAPALQRLLDADRLQNVYMRSELRQGIAAGDWWGLHVDGELRGAVIGGSVFVPCIPRIRDAAPLEETACAVAPPRVLVVPRPAVLAMDAGMTTKRTDCY